MSAPSPEPTTPQLKPGKPDPAEQPEGLRRHARLMGWLVLAIIVAYGAFQLPLPWRLLSLAAGVAGVAGGIVLIVRCVKDKTPALFWISAVLVIICCGMFALLGAMQAMFWDASVIFDQCRVTAVTERGMARCFSEYQENMLSSVPGSN